MQNRRTVFLLISLIILVIAFFSIWNLRPAIATITPENGAKNQSRRVPIRITFTRSMQAQSVLDALRIVPVVEGEMVYADQILTFTPAQPWPKGEQIMISFEAGARSRIGLPLIPPTSRFFQTVSTRLAYLWPSVGDADIYALDPISGEVQRLTTLGTVLDYDIVGDERLYFSSTNAKLGSDLYQLDLDSGAVEVVLACGAAACQEVQIAPTGDRLAYLRAEATATSLWLLDLLTGEETEISAKGHDARLPNWAADGRLAYYDITDAGYRFLDLDGGTMVRWANALGEAGTWQPNGVAFIAPAPVQVETDALRGPTGEASNEDVPDEALAPVVIFTTHLMEFKFTNSFTQNLTGVKLWEDSAPVFSNDGQWLVFARRDLSDVQAATARQLWLMHPSGAAAQSLTDDPVYKYLSFAWHPAGNQLAAMRFNNIELTEPPEIWLIEIPSGSKVRLVIDGFSPQWIP